MPLQGSLTIERMCFLAGVSRAGFYRYLRTEDLWQEEMDVRSEVQRIVLEHNGRYGYRRITAELRRQGMPVNHKRVARLLLLLRLHIAEFIERYYKSKAIALSRRISVASGIRADDRVV